MTFATKSGRCRAFSTRLFLARSTIMRSVPAEMSEAAVRTRTPLAGALGVATSTRFSAPVL
ncbi:MAG: hypothetical protein IPG50_29775 [Myxococcales bacterium]|nr:hypothetical protein [Myxococcales bacterium]